MARKQPSKSFDIQTVKAAAAGRWPEILSALGGISPGILDGKHHPCPKCGGTDRFRMVNADAGALLCNQCFTTKNGDGLAAIQWLKSIDFGAALAEIASYLGIKPSSSSNKKKKDPAEHLTFQPWNPALINLWCLKKPGITPEAVQAAGGRLARYRGQHTVLAVPAWGADFGQAGAVPVGWVLWNITGGDLPVFAGKGKPPKWVKMKTTAGSVSGLIVAGNPSTAKTTWKTEGPGDAMALGGRLRAAGVNGQLIVTNSGGAKDCPPWQVALLSSLDAPINVIPDADEPGIEGADKWVGNLARAGSTVRRVDLPFPVTATRGKDLRDYLTDDQPNHSFADLQALAASTIPITPATAPAAKPNEADDDPHRLAHVYIDKHASHADYDAPTLRYWREEWYLWTAMAGCYRKIPVKEFRAGLTLAVKAEFDRIHLDEQAAATGDKEPVVKRVTMPVVTNALDALRSLTVLHGRSKMMSWIGPGHDSTRSLIALANGLLDVNALLSRSDDHLFPADPGWFSEVCLPYEFDPHAEAPTWTAFLTRNLESDHERAALLQEWAGYLLTPDTSQQKFLILEGEGSNGKSVFFAAIRAMLGKENVSHVSLEVFGGEFQKTETLGKLANIAADCNELDKVAEGVVKSFTSGDPLFFNRKGISGLNAVPTARLMIGTNNLPRFADRSSGIWRRMILVPWRVEIPEAQRRTGMDSVEFWEDSGDLPGIFNWALAGLHRLRKQGRFTDSTICTDAHNEYKTDSNPAKMFLLDACEINEESQIPTLDLYSLYRKWCETHGNRPLADKTFGKEVRRTFKKTERRRCGNRGDRFYAYVGIQLSPEHQYAGI